MDYSLKDRSIGYFRSCVTMSSSEEREHTIHGVTKEPFEHQMGTVPQVLVHLAPRKSEAPTALLVLIDKTMERLTLATLSVSESQEATSNSLCLRHV